MRRPFTRREAPRHPEGHLPTAARGLAIGALLVLAVPAASAAQNVEDQLRTLTEENARLYARPVTAGLGAAMNSGWFQGAGIQDPPGFSLDLRLMGAMVPKEDETFTPDLPRSVTVEFDGQSRTYQDPYGQAAGFTTPTVAGEGEGVTVEPQGQLRSDLEDAGEDPSDYALRFPDGLDVPAVPMVVPQASVVLPMSTEVAVRWMPSIQVAGEIGEVKALGVGLRHSLSAWLLDDAPVDVAVSGGIQRFEAGDYLTADSRTVGLTVSKTLSILTLYASGGLEGSDVDVTYQLENPALSESGRTVEFRDQGANEERLSVGLSLDVLFLEFSADYTASNYEVVHASVGLGF
jgi:hypothetical protein